jgi:hypothetical protein
MHHRCPITGQTTLEGHRLSVMSETRMSSPTHGGVEIWVGDGPGSLPSLGTKCGGWLPGLNLARGFPPSGKEGILGYQIRKEGIL